MGSSSRFYRFILAETVYHQSALLGFLDVSAGNVCGLGGGGLLYQGLLWGKATAQNSEVGGRGGGAAESTWIGSWLVSLP